MDAATIAFVQAAAAITALGIAVTAVTVPWRQQRRREQAAEREQTLKTRCLATAISFDLHEIATSLAAVRLTATGQSFLSSIPGGAAIQEVLATKVELPPTIVSSRDQVYLLGDPAGPTLLRLLAILKIYNAAVDQEADLCITEPAINAGERWGHLLGFVQDVQPKIEEAIKLIAPFANGTSQHPR